MGGKGKRAAPNYERVLILNHKTDFNDRLRNKAGLFFLPPPTSLKHEIYGLTSGFTRLIMMTKYVSHNLVSLRVKFHDNRIKWTVTSNIKICRWGEKEEEPKAVCHDLCVSYDAHKVYKNAKKWFQEPTNDISFAALKFDMSTYALSNHRKKKH